MRRIIVLVPVDSISSRTYLKRKPLIKFKSKLENKVPIIRLKMWKLDQYPQRPLMKGKITWRTAKSSLFFARKSQIIEKKVERCSQNMLKFLHRIKIETKRQRKDNQTWTFVTLGKSNLDRKAVDKINGCYFRFKNESRSMRIKER